MLLYRELIAELSEMRAENNKNEIFDDIHRHRLLTYLEISQVAGITS